MRKKIIVAFLVSLLALLCISVKVSSGSIDPPTLLTIDDKPVVLGDIKTSNRNPTLVGKCNLPFAIMEYGMRNSPDLGSGHSDGKGMWRWTVPEPLGYGVHILYVTATDPNDSTNTETSAFQLEISKSGASIIQLGLPWFLAIIILYLGAFTVWKRLELRSEKG